ncbi:SCO family protein [Pseudomonas luteola]|nr:SCO family protein [Pseudomonas zeshuii]
MKVRRHLARSVRLVFGLIMMVIFCATVQAANIFDPFTMTGIDQKLGTQVPLEARFTDQNGQPVRLGDLLHKRPVVLVPVYYTCPNVCGAQLATLFKVLEAVGYRVGEDYDVIAYSFNPAETPVDAQAERDKLRKLWPQLVDSPDVHFLVGVEGASKALSEAIGFRYRYDPDIQQYAHVSAVGVLTGEGRLARWLYGLGYQPNDMRLAITEAGQGQVGSLGDQLLLLCYHYNPKVGGYDNLVIRALQVGGIATVLTLAGFIGFSLRRDWRKRKSAS